MITSRENQELEFCTEWILYFLNFAHLVIDGDILLPRGRALFGQHQKSRPLARPKTGSPRFTDFPSFCACSASSLTNLTGSGLNLLCLQSHSKPKCRWTWPEVAILGADQKERRLCGRECDGEEGDGECDRDNF